MMRVLAVLLALAGLSTIQGAPMIGFNRAIKPLLSPSKNSEIIPDQYVVMLREDVGAESVDEHHTWLSNYMALVANSDQEHSSGHRKHKNRVRHLYDLPNGMKGYSGTFDEEAINAIRQSEHVAYVEPDQIMRIQDEPYLGFNNHHHHAEYDLQEDAPWGLSRISHREKPSQDHYSDYPYIHGAGSNVTVMVIDTGINIKHKDFGGRAYWGATIPENDEDLDGNGHGSHCAGTIAGRRYGVAKNANVVAIKVLRSNGSGSMSDVIKGVEFALNDHRRRQNKNKHAKSVANMSLGGGSSRTLDRAVNAAVRGGIHFAVAAGNDNQDACNYSPAAAELAVTVGATDNQDRMAWFSNHGKCVDVFAPGKDIKSVWIGSNTATNTISGTSMASPHVAGLLAYYLSENPEHDYSTKELKEKVIKSSIKDVIKGLPKPGDKLPQDPDWPFPWPPPGGDNGNLGKTENRLAFTGGAPEHKTGSHRSKIRLGLFDDMMLNALKNIYTM